MAMWITKFRRPDWADGHCPGNGDRSRGKAEKAMEVTFDKINDPLGQSQYDQVIYYI